MVAVSEKDIEENNLTKLSHLTRRTSINFQQRSKPPASLPLRTDFKINNTKSTSSAPHWREANGGDLVPEI
ncbi:MAG: hypothetical protein JNL67_05245 [Planctomycetaceae bacterium]|nr:hypothetical protein [Planctomycetaceae bacterium]